MAEIKNEEVTFVPCDEGLRLTFNIPPDMISVALSDQVACQLAVGIVEHYSLGIEADNDSNIGKGEKMIESERLIIFNKEVGGESVRQLQEILLEMALREKTKSPEERKPITLFINSEGGNCIDGFALIETIKLVQNMGIQVIGVVQGCAFSMASAILQACKPRYVGPYSMIMIHQVKCDISGGRLDENVNKINTIVDINSNLAKVYADHNTVGKTAYKYWLKMMQKNDVYYMAQDAVKFGLADGVFTDDVVKERWADEIDDDEDDE